MATLKLTEKSLATIGAPVDVPQAYYWDTEVRGFGVVVGRTGQRTFVVRGRANGKLVKRTIGIAGAPRDSDGHVWTVQLARIEARKKLGSLAGGDPPPTRREVARANVGPTLREALALHVGKMERGENRRRKACSPRSIRTIRGDVERHLRDWLDRPLVELNREAVRGVMETIEREATRVAGSNPANPPGRAVANRLVAHVSAIWRSQDDETPLPVACPVKMKMQAALEPRDNRIANDDLPSWHQTVLGLENPIRRDLQLVALFTGVRTDGVRSLRWEDVDFDDELLQVARAKGDRPYTIPMTATVREVLERRRHENPTIMAELGGDHGFVFPTVSRDGERVIALAEAKERIIIRDRDGKAMRDELGNLVRESLLPGVQACRKTFNSVALEIGIPREAREALMNHEGRGVNVRSYGFPQNWDYLRTCTDQIEAALWARIKGETKKRRGRLRAVA